MATDTRINVPAFINGVPNTSGQATVYQTNTKTGQTITQTYSSQAQAQAAVNPSGAYVGAKETYTLANEPGIVRDTKTGNIVSQPAPAPVPATTRVVTLPEGQGAYAVDLRTVGLGAGTSSYGGGVVAPGYQVGRGGKVIPIGGTTTPTTQLVSNQSTGKFPDVMAIVNQGYNAPTSSFSTQNAKAFSIPKDTRVSALPDLRTKEESLADSRQALAGQLTSTAIVGSVVGAPIGIAALGGGALATGAVGLLFGETIGGLSSVAKTGKVDVKDVATNVAVGGALGFAGGYSLTKLFGSPGMVQISEYAPSGKVAETIVRIPGGTYVNRAYTNVASALGDLGESGTIGRGFTPTVTSQTASLIPKAWTSGTGVYGFNLGRSAGNLVEPLAGRGAATVVSNIVGSKPFLPLVGLGLTLAAPEVTVATKTTASQKPTNLTSEQWEKVFEKGFEIENVESVYKRQDINRTIEKEGKQYLETGYSYTPREDVPGIDVPVFGRMTAYSVFPSVAVDYFSTNIAPMIGLKGGGAYATESFKKGAKQQALEFGLTEPEAGKAADYAWYVQGEARSQGEILGLLPATVTGELIGQTLAKQSVATGLKQVGIEQIGKQFVWAKTGDVLKDVSKKNAKLIVSQGIPLVAGITKDKAVSATAVAGQVIFKKTIMPLAVAGIVEGGSFGYLSGQAQGQKGTQLALTTAIGAGVGGFSAPVIGSKIAQWTVTKPLLGKAGTGLVYIADYTEYPGDVGASALTKFFSGGTSKAVSGVPIKTNTLVAGIAPTKTPVGTLVQTFIPTSTPTTIFTPTTTPVNTIIGTPTNTTVPTPIITPVPSTTITNIFTTTETPVSTSTSTNIFTSVFTPVSTPVMTLTPNIPLMPFFGLPGSDIGSGGRGAREKTKYYNELDQALGEFRGFNFLSAPRRKGKRRTVKVGGQLHYVGKKVNVKKLIGK